MHVVFCLRRPTSSRPQRARTGTYLRWACMLHNPRRRLTVCGAASRPRAHPDRSTPPLHGPTRHAPRGQHGGTSPRPPQPRLHCAAASVGGVRATHPQGRNNNSARRPPPAPPPVWSTTRHARAGCAGRRRRQKAKDKTRAPPWPGALATRRSPPLLLSCCTIRGSQRRRRGEREQLQHVCRCAAQAQGGLATTTAAACPRLVLVRQSITPPRVPLSPQKRGRLGTPRRANRPPRVVSPSPGVRRRPPAPPSHGGCRHAGRGLCRYCHREGGGRGVAARPRALDGSSNEGRWVSQGKA